MGRVYKRFKYTAAAFCLVMGSQYLMSKGEESFMDSYFANATENEFVELDNEYIYSPDGAILD